MAATVHLPDGAVDERFGLYSTADEAWEAMEEWFSMTKQEIEAAGFTVDEGP